MNSIAETDAQAMTEVVVTLGEYQFTRQELNDLFNRVADKSNWKLSIDTRIEIKDQRERIGLHLAIPFFTGSTATLELVGTIKDATVYRVTAAGYYNAVGA